MTLAPSLLALAPGVALGTLLNNLAGRLLARRAGLHVRATCAHCGYEMSLAQSVAFVSFLSRRGRCPRCGARRSLRGLVLELGAGVLAVACFARFGFSGRAFIASAFCAVLLLLALIDTQKRVLPNAIVLPAAFGILAADIAVAPSRSLEWIAAALAAGLALLALALAHRGSIGMGDVKLAFLLGAGLGKAVALALFVSFLGVFFPAAFLIATRGLSARKETIPFGPFLAAGAVIALLAT